MDESKKGFEKISQSIESVGKSIGDGLLTLVSIIGRKNHVAPPILARQQYQQEFYYQSHVTYFRSNT